MAKRKAEKQDKSVYVKLDKQLYDEIVCLSEMYHCNRSDVVRAAIKGIYCYRKEIFDSGGNFFKKNA